MNNILIKKENIKTDLLLEGNIVGLEDEEENFILYVLVKGFIYQKKLKKPFKENDYLIKQLKKNNIQEEDFLNEAENYTILVKEDRKELKIARIDSIDIHMTGFLLFLLLSLISIVIYFPHSFVITIFIIPILFFTFVFLISLHEIYRINIKGIISSK